MFPVGEGGGVGVGEGGGVGEGEGSGAASTVKVASLLVTLPSEFDTIQVNTDPSSDKVATEVVYTVELAPDIFAPFFLH